MICNSCAEQAREENRKIDIRIDFMVWKESEVSYVTQLAFNLILLRLKIILKTFHKYIRKKDPAAHLRLASYGTLCF